MKELSLFGKALEAHMSKTGISKKMLAEAMGVSPSSVTQYFEGSPSIDTVIRIAVATNARAYWLIAAIELPKMPVEAFKIIEEIFFLSQKKREFFLRQMIEIKKLMDEIEKEANNK